MENAHSVQQIEERGAGSQAERNPDRIHAPGGVQNLEEEVERRNPGRHRVEEVADSHPGRNEPPRAVRRLDWEEQERSQRVRRPLENEGSFAGRYKDDRDQAQSESAAILAQVKEMVDQLRAEVAGKNMEEDSFRVSSPFTWRIQEYEMPEKLKLPTMELYDGSTNPRDHIMTYKTMMEIQTTSDAVLCRVFPTTLKGAARRWYQDLKPASIGSFPELAQEFMSRFIAGVPAARKTSYLETIVQEKDESLRDYVVRFNREALQIPNLDQARAVEAMQKGTTNRPFFNSLSKNSPETLSRLMGVAEKYIRQDDAFRASRFSGKRRREEEEAPKQKSQKPGDHQRPPMGRRPFPKPENLTPLNAPRAEIFMTIKHQNCLRWPRELTSDPEDRDQTRFCHFHKTHGHTTNECHQLIAEIERLIKKGHLHQFVDRRTQGQRGEGSASKGKEPMENTGANGTIL